MIKNAMQRTIEKAMIDAGVSKAELARRIGTSPSNLCNRLKTGKFTYEELVAIATALNCNLIFGFEPAQATERM